jgi:hypothetical protein
MCLVVWNELIEVIYGLVQTLYFMLYGRLPLICPTAERVTATQRAAKDYKLTTRLKVHYF